jgi:ubiquinone/menaquinone biosynthesis C-methylase UbiE
VAEVELLRSVPRTRRNVNARAEAKTPEVLAEARKFGQAYFDGPRDYGYGGYHYDGRWIAVARDIVDHFGLKPGMRVLDIGCAKGFLVADLMSVCPGLEVFGLDISDYALKHCHPDVVGRLHLGDCVSLPFPDNSFDAVLAINVIHNLDRPDVVRALKEIVRVGRGDRAFVQVDSYRTEAEKAEFEAWVLTARYVDYPQNWYRVFDEAGYRGDWAWTLVSD